MEEGPSSSSGFSTRATAALQEPPVNRIHSMVRVDDEKTQREATSRGCGCEWSGVQSLYRIFLLPYIFFERPANGKRNCSQDPFPIFLF